MEFDDRRAASLDGVWDFFPGDHQLADLATLAAEPISVPGLWEAQGWLDLDGAAWYRRRFHLDDTSGHWSLRFDAVMDQADVFLNGASTVIPGDFDGIRFGVRFDVRGGVILFVDPQNHRVLLRREDGPFRRGTVAVF